MAPTVIQVLRAQFTAETAALRQATRDARNMIRESAGQIKAGLGDIAGGVTSLMKRVTMGIGAVVGAGFALERLFVSVASDAEETNSKFTVVFGNLEQQAQQWSDGVAEATGRYIGDIKSWMSGLQDMFEPAGFAQNAAFDLSKQVTQLGIDLASFNHIATEEAIAKLTSGLTGEFETLRDFGVMLDAEMVKEEAWRRGMAETGKELTVQQKMLTIMQLIMERTTKAQGDAERTAKEYANMLVRLSGMIKSVRRDIGNVLKPVAKEIVGYFQETAQAVRSWVKENDALLRQRVREYFDKAVAGAQALWKVLGKVYEQVRPLVVSIIEWIKEHPKLTAALVATIAFGGPILEIVGGVTKLVGGIANLSRGLIGLAGSATRMTGVLGAVGKGGLVVAVAGLGYAAGKAIGKVLKLDKVILKLFYDSDTWAQKHDFRSRGQTWVGERAKERMTRAKEILTTIKEHNALIGGELSATDIEDAAVRLARRVDVDLDIAADIIKEAQKVMARDLAKAAGDQAEKALTTQVEAVSAGMGDFGSFVKENAEEAATDWSEHFGETLEKRDIGGMFGGDMFVPRRVRDVRRGLQIENLAQGIMQEFGLTAEMVRQGVEFQLLDREWIMETFGVDEETLAEAMQHMADSVNDEGTNVADAFRDAGSKIKTAITTSFDLKGQIIDLAGQMQEAKAGVQQAMRTGTSLDVRIARSRYQLTREKGRFAMSRLRGIGADFEAGGMGEMVRGGVPRFGRKGMDALFTGTAGALKGARGDMVGMGDTIVKGQSRVLEEVYGLREAVREINERFPIGRPPRKNVRT